jgi:hypothetical protein
MCCYLPCTRRTFHNFEHASHVVTSTAKLLSRIHSSDFVPTMKATTESNSMIMPAASHRIL